MSKPTPAELQAQAEAVDAAFAAAAGTIDVATKAADPNPLRVFAGVLEAALFSAKALNDHQNFRSRELSVAITNLETALLWVQKAAA